MEGSRVKILSKHPFKTASARGVTWSIWHQSQGLPLFGQTKAAHRTTVSVKKWIYELRQALSNPNVKIRISKCTEPTRGCCCNDSDEGSTESLECSEGVSFREWTGVHGIIGTNDGCTESLERPEETSSPTQGERTRGNGIAGSEDGNTEGLERREGFPSPTRGEWTGAHGVAALLVCLVFWCIFYFLLLS